MTNLATKCEKYIFKVLSNEHDEEGDNEINDEDSKASGNESDDGDSKPSIKRREIKIPKNAKASSLEYIMIFGFASLLIAGYFIGIYIVSHLYISHSQLLTDEINSLS